MTSNELRQAFLEFFRGHGHEIVASSPLVPGNDPTLLFTNAGMVQFKDVFLGEDKRSYKRAVTSQRCVRAGGKHNDLENVGYTAGTIRSSRCSATSAFGDYFKEDAIRYAWEFLTGACSGLPEERLWVTVFEDDDEAADIWLKTMKVDPDRFTRMGAKDNFWAMGDTGPCGPCSEIFYDHGPDVAGRTAGLARRGRRSLRRDLESRLHAVRPFRRWRDDAVAQSRPSTPAWGSNAPPPSCRACTAITRSTCSRT